MGALIASIQLFFLPKKRHFFQAPLNRYFFFTSFGFVVLFYLYLLSLTKTTGTNLILLANFAPVFTLIVASFFWRRELSYMKNFKYIRSIFLVFIVGGIGSMLLFFNDIQNGTSGNIAGNLIALSVMLVDIVYIIGQIRYMKSFPTSFTGYVVSVIGF